MRAKNEFELMAEAYHEVQNENLLKLAAVKKGWKETGKQLSQSGGSSKPAKDLGPIKGRKKPGMWARMGGQESEKIDHELAGLIDLYATAVGERIIDMNNPYEIYRLGNSCNGTPGDRSGMKPGEAYDSKYQPLLDIYCIEDDGGLQQINDIVRRYQREKSGSVVYYTEGN